MYVLYILAIIFKRVYLSRDFDDDTYMKHIDIYVFKHIMCIYIYTYVHMHLMILVQGEVG